MYINYFIIGLIASLGWHLGKWIMRYLDDMYDRHQYEKRKKKRESNNNKTKRIGFV